RSVRRTRSDGEREAARQGSLAPSSLAVEIITGGRSDAPFQFRGRLGEATGNALVHHRLDFPVPAGTSHVDGDVQVDFDGPPAAASQCMVRDDPAGAV